MRLGGAITMTTITNTAPKSNVSNLGADLLLLAKRNDEVKAGPVFLAHTYTAELTALAARVMSQDSEGTRKELLAYFTNSPEGAKFNQQYEALKNNDAKTQVQTNEQKSMLLVQNAAVMLLTRACDTVRGVNVLRDIAKCHVLIERVNGLQSWACFVYRDAADDREYLKFTAAQLQQAGKIKGDTIAVDGKKVLLSNVLVKDIRLACQSAKKGEANDKKGDASKAIEAAAMPSALEAIDTALNRFEDDDGQLNGKIAENAAMVWARLDVALTIAQKNKARSEFNKMAAKEIVADVNAKSKLEKAIGRGKRKSA
jgi:hypothetical protein